MNKKITPKEITKKVSSKNDNYLLIKDSEGDLYSVWNQEIFSYFFEGSEIDVVVEIKGKYKNIVAVNEGTVQVEPTFKQSVQYPSSKPSNGKDDDIKFEVSKKIAGNLLSAAITAKELNLSDAVDMFKEVVQKIDSVKNGK